MIEIQRPGDKILADGEDEHVDMLHRLADDHNVQRPEHGADNLQCVAIVNPELVVDAQQVNAQGCDHGSGPRLPADSLPPADEHHDGHQDDIEPREKARIPGGGVFHASLLTDRGRYQQHSGDGRPPEKVALRHLW